MALLTALAAALRFVYVGRQGYWLDEGITVSLLKTPFFHMLHAIRFRESTPQLYYIAAWVWGRLFGFSEAGLRSLSALAGVLVVPVAYGLGRRLASPRVGLVAAALVACSPLLIWYSQEARPYELLALFAALSLLTFERARENPTAGRLALWAAVCALGMLTHYFEAMLFVPEAAWLVVVHARRWKVWAASAAAAAVGAALIPLAQSEQQFTTWISADPLGVRLRQLRTQSLVGFAVPHAAALWLIAILIVVLAATLLAFRAEPRERLGGIRMAIIGLAGFGLAMAPELAGKDLVNSRNLIELLPALAAFLACGLGARRAGSVGLAGAGVLCAIGITGTFYIDAHPNLQRADWRPIARALGAPPQPAARVVLLLRYGSPFPIALYQTRLMRMSPTHPVRVGELDVVSVQRAPGVSACWWGAACSLHAVKGLAPPSLAGFRPAARVQRGRFVLIRLRAPRPRRETPSTLTKAVPIANLKPYLLLVELPRGAANTIDARTP
jgi:mannosyltransferase